jgi:DeoR/GlpR family transcriptional regulator of sugar metabolism
MTLRETIRSRLERRDAIARIIEERGRASVLELSELFSVSGATLRKDLAGLEEEGRLVRTHGGALASRPGGFGERDRTELAFEVRERLCVAEKVAIAGAAAELVREGDSIALDASTTALHVAKNLRSRRELTVVTNGIRIAAELAGLPGYTVLMPGGVLRWEAFSLIGEWGAPMLRRIHIETAFLGAVGFTLTEGLTDVNTGESQFKRLLVEAARSVVAVIDSSKWDRVALTSFCPIERLNLVITDSRAPAGMVESVRGLGIEVRTVEVGSPESDETDP